MLELVEGVVLDGERGGEVFTAVVVDQGDMGGVAFHLGRGDEPAERVVGLTEVAGERPVEVLSGHGDALVVEIDTQKNIVLAVV